MKLLTLLLVIQVIAPPIDVNTATKVELLTIEGITPTVADHIIRDRPYTTVEDVQGGVPRFLFEKIRTRITVTSSPLNAITRVPRTVPGTPASQPFQIQVIQGNRIDRVRFEAPPQENAVEVPADKSNPPSTEPKKP